MNLTIKKNDPINNMDFNQEVEVELTQKQKKELLLNRKKLAIRRSIEKFEEERLFREEWEH